MKLPDQNIQCKIASLSTNHFASCEHMQLWITLLITSLAFIQQDCIMIMSKNFLYLTVVYIFKVPINGVIISYNKCCGINIKGERMVMCMTRAHSLIICKINKTLLVQGKDKVQSQVQSVQSDGILCYGWRMCVHLVVASLLYKAAMTF